MHLTKTTIHLTHLHFYAYHGVLPQERVVGGHYTVDVALDCTLSDRALLHDELEGTVDYAAVYATIGRIMARPHRLLEHLAHDIADTLLGEFERVERVRLTVRKDTPPMGGHHDGCAFELEAVR